MVTIGQPARITYTNYRGETDVRIITPQRVWYGSTEWHPEPQWLLTAFDHEKQANRDFALTDFGYKAVAALFINGARGTYKRWDDLVSAQQSPAVSNRAISSLPVTEGCKTVDELAAFLCDEFDFNLDPVHGASWPEHENDDGKREGGYIRLQPSDVQAYARENAKRILAFLALPVLEVKP